MHLSPESSSEVLRRFPPAHARKLGERVLIRPCVEVEKERTPLRVLAYACDGLSQSLLVALGERLWTEASPIHPGGVGYPVLPISLANVPEPSEDAPPAPAAGGAGDVADDASAAAAPIQEAQAAAAAAEDEDEDEDEAETFVTPAWDQAESVWRRLEAAGVLELERDDEALPTRASLVGGGSTWLGALPGSAEGSPPVEVIIFGSVPSDVPGGAWELEASTAAPECGFCRFMKMGPCGVEFVAWEKCIEKARDTKEDFVDLCGKQTMDLKLCTDRHPEYYGVLGGADDDEEGPAPEAPPEPPAAGTAPAPPLEGSTQAAATPSA